MKETYFQVVEWKKRNDFLEIVFKSEKYLEWNSINVLHSITVLLAYHMKI